MLKLCRKFPWWFFSFFFFDSFFWMWSIFSGIFSYERQHKTQFYKRWLLHWFQLTISGLVWAIVTAMLQLQTSNWKLNRNPLIWIISITFSLLRWCLMRYGVAIFAGLNCTLVHSKLPFLLVTVNPFLKIPKPKLTLRKTGAIRIVISDWIEKILNFSPFASLALEGSTFMIFLASRGNGKVWSFFPSTLNLMRLGRAYQWQTTLFSCWLSMEKFAFIQIEFIILWEQI